MQPSGMSGLLTGQSLRPRVSSKNHTHPANPFLILLKLDRWVGRMTPHEQCNSNQQHQPKVHQRESKLAQAHLRLLQLQYKGVSTPFSVQLRHVSNRWNKNTHHVKNTHTHTSMPNPLRPKARESPWRRAKPDCLDTSSKAPQEMVKSVGVLINNSLHLN